MFRFSVLVISGSIAVLPFTATYAGQCTTPDTAGPVKQLTDAQQRAVFVHDTAILKRFTLANTLDSILNTMTPGSQTQSNREALLQTLLDSLKAPSLYNPESMLTFTLNPRPGEANLSPAALLDPEHKDGMQVIGVFSRLDLAPRSYQNCGEYRIVYAKASHSQRDRMTIIFEAALPNPYGPGRPEGCRSAVKLWDSFQSKTSDVIASELEAFFYKGGLTGQGDVIYEPVVHAKHYGSPSGQVRANIFINQEGMAGPWHLMQWRVTKDIDSRTVFTSMPLDENAVPAMYGGNADGISPEAQFQRLRDSFQSDFISTNVDQLTVKDIASAESHSAMTETELIAGIGLHVGDRYLTFDSNADAVDDPQPRGSRSRFAARIDQKLFGIKLSSLCNLTADHVLARAGAMTCGGCHEFSRNKEIAPGIRWPNSLGFVHINEAGTASQLLLDRFLPSRKAIQDRFLAAPQMPSTSRAEMDRQIALQRERIANAATLVSAPALRAYIEEQLSNLAARRAEKNEPGAFVSFRRTH